MSIITEHPSVSVLDLTKPVTGRVAPKWKVWFKSVFQICYSLQDSGPTENRPINNLWAGRRYYDATLDTMIFVKSVNPTIWVNIMGISV